MAKNREDGKVLLDQIAREEAKLTGLEKEQKEVRARIEALKARLASIEACEAEQASTELVRDAQVSDEAAEKARLFGGLFRGRPDVYPKLWINWRTGRKGYSPACSNEWVRGLCDKKKVKCGQCQNKAFLPVTDEAILEHLRGRHVMGVYPLLEDETCWFLAVDFDKSSWMEDAKAFAETCRELDIPVSLERSRSGNGAHAWFFFTAPTPASLARKMGCYLLTQTMSRRHQLSMESYDRLFPNQDTMPRGGFGNLIALPLQWESVRQGNTVFLDSALEPFPDQWSYLAGLHKVEPKAVERIAKEAMRQGRVIGVRSGESVDEDDAFPWTHPPSGRSRKATVCGPLPGKVQAVLAQRLFVEKAGLPSSLLNEIKRLAAFQNPEFYKKQSMRLSTARTPRVIDCSEEKSDHMSLPRGCVDDLEKLFREYDVGFDVEDKRETGEALEVHFRGQLTPMQEQAGRALLAHETGVFVAPPGVGKTVVGTYLVAERARSTLVLVHRQTLLDQWMTKLAMFLSIKSKEIGQIGGGKRAPNGRLDVAMIQSLVRKGQVADLVADYGHVIVDECHHIPAFSFERVLSEVKARFITGLTATPQRRDGHHPIARMQLGPVRFTVDPKSRAARMPFEHKLIVRETSFEVDGGDEMEVQKLYGKMAADEHRNRLILDDVLAALEEGRSPILLTERRSHLEYFEHHLRGFARNVVVLKGGRSEKKRREVAEQLVRIPDNQERLILATGRYIGEGFDDPRLDTLFLAMPVSWKGILMQYTGRLHRLHPGKTEVRIFDYVDSKVPVLVGMFKKRLRGYRSIGYARGETPLGCAALDEDPVVEYDENVLRQLEEMD